MSRVLYFDCFSGISGDMVIGALVDAGLPFDELTRALGSLAMSGYHVHTERVLRAGVSATQFIVHEEGAAAHAAAPAGEGAHHHHGHSREDARLKPRATEGLRRATEDDDARL